MTPKKLFIIALLIVGTQAVCNDIEVVSQTYTSGDALLSKDNAIIIEIESNCEEYLSLHGLVEGQLLPVAKSLGSGQYQLSWTESHATTKTGRRIINFYDDEGATAIRKSLRYGEKASTRPLFSVEINNKGVKQDMLVGPAFIAVMVGVVIWWLAYTTKTRLQE